MLRRANSSPEIANFPSVSRQAAWGRKTVSWPRDMGRFRLRQCLELLGDLVRTVAEQATPVNILDQLVAATQVELPHDIRAMA
jgi:hypothetical protein